MGGLWWWVWASSAQEIVDTCAEVEVVTEPDAVRRAETWSLEEFDLGVLPLDSSLASLRAQRDQQRHLPGFGAVAGRDRVCLRLPPDDGEDVVRLIELGPDGRRIRQVEIASDGTAVQVNAEDLPFNPPFDLFDPQYAPMEIDRDEFEDAWGRARPDPERPS
jgi:hypothetical protein